MNNTRIFDMRFPREDDLTFADEQIIKLIQHFPTLYRSRYDVLRHLFLIYTSGCVDHWDADGNLIVTDIPDEEPTLSWDHAVHIYLYGDQDHVTIIGPDWTDDNVMITAPDNVSKEWLDIIEDFICYLVKFKPEDYKIHILASRLRGHERNQVGFQDWYPRYIRGYDKACVGLDKIAERFGWTYWMRDVYHSEEKEQDRKDSLNKLLTEILAEADSDIKPRK